MIVEDRVGMVTPRVICMIINEAYSGSMPASQRFTEIIKERNDAIIESRENKVMKMRPVTHENGLQHLHLHPKVDNLLSNEDFLWILNAQRIKLNDYKQRTSSIKRRLLQMKAAIENELGL